MFYWGMDVLFKKKYEFGGQKCSFWGHKCLFFTSKCFTICFVMFCKTQTSIISYTFKNTEVILLGSYQNFPKRLFLTWILTTSLECRPLTVNIKHFYNIRILQLTNLRKLERLIYYDCNLLFTNLQNKYSIK